MPKPALLQSEESYTFSEYFKLDYDIEDILAYFGYSFRKTALDLPRSSTPPGNLADLTNRLESALVHVGITSEAARREFLIAPVLMELMRLISLKIKVGYPINVSNQLKGAINYYLESENSLLVIEAKDENLQRGFTQLAVELIAMEQWTDEPNPCLYGAVSIGNVWQFGKLEKESKEISQDVQLYRVVADLGELMSILVGILGQ